jgi:hypothetical protein
MRLAHDVQPLVRRRLAVAVEQLADAIDEDLGAAAGMLSRPAATSRSITVGTAIWFSREMCSTSGGDSACSLKSG